MSSLERWVVIFLLIVFVLAWNSLIGCSQQTVQKCAVQFVGHADGITYLRYQCVPEAN